MNIKKIYDYMLLLSVAFLFLLLVSVLMMGWNLSIGNISTKEIEIPNGEIVIGGRPNTPNIQIFGGSEIMYADCRVGVGGLCWDYRGRNLYAKNIKLLVINNESSALIYADLESKERKFTIDNSRNIQSLVTESVARRRVYPKFFLFATMISFLLLLIVFVVKKKIEAK
ncbi:MAG: hypothetical protein Q4C79_13015 [Neisseria sp.]|nr:hypothetical protein [Neisseria sp.]